MMLAAADIHARLAGGRWTEVLRALGVGDEYLRRRKQGPCPVCGGRDRFCYDDRNGRGDFICRHCGAGDAFTLLMRLNRWSFAEAAKRVAEAAGLQRPEYRCIPGARALRAPEATAAAATPTRRVRDILRGSCDPADVLDVREYLSSRGLWPLPAPCALRAHAGVDYYHERTVVGRYAALVAPVRDIDDALVTIHVTYLHEGRKLTGQEPRKLLSPLTGRVGCAVRLLPLDGDVLGIGEGCETALSAARIHDVPVWAALNTSLLAKFVPPVSVKRLVIFADRDASGLEAAAHLAEQLQGRINFEIRAPAAPAKDWNDSTRYRETDDGSSPAHEQL
jgi:putative DNA primase/helicase